MIRESDLQSKCDCEKSKSPSNMENIMIKFDEQSIINSEIASNKNRKLISVPVQRFVREKIFDLIIHDVITQIETHIRVQAHDAQGLLFCDCLRIAAVMPPRRSPRLVELAQRAVSVPFASDDDDTESLQSTAVCVVCGDDLRSSSLVHIPCCDYLTHPMCVDDDIDAFCLYCSMDLRSTLEHIGNSSCPECVDSVDPSSAGHGDTMHFLMLP